MLAIVAVVIAAAIAAVLIYAATKPNSFAISRSTLIDAPPERIFPLIDDLHAQSAWSPFEKDPAMKRTHSGAPRGKGAVYEWDGNRQVGGGRLTITDSVAPSRVSLLLDIYRPFKAHNTVDFTLTRAGGGTDVTWCMQGPQPFMAKLVGLFMNCDKMVGGEFEQGLAKLKALAESQAPGIAAE